MIRLTCVVAGLCLFVACGGGGSNNSGDAGVDAGDQDGMALDTTAPTVVSVTPADDATGVVASANIEVVFSEALDAATVIAGNFVVEPGGYDSISYDTATFTVTLTRVAGWAAGTTYDLSISGVADPTGNVASDFASSFTTAASAAARIDGGGAATHGNVALAFDDNGNGVAAWQIQPSRLNETRTVVAVAYYTRSTDSWSAEVVFDDMIGTPLLASNGSGFLLVTSYNSREIIYETATWTADVAATDTGMYSPDGLITNGTTYAIWDRQNEEVSVYTPGGAWSETAVDGGITKDFKVVTDGVSYGAAWIKSGSVYFSALLSGGWSTPVPVENDLVDTAYHSNIVGGPGGNAFLITWSQDDGGVGTDDEIWAALYTDDGTDATESVGPNVVGTGISTINLAPAMTANSTGYVLAWEGAGDTVMGATSADASSWTVDTVHTSTGRIERNSIELAADYNRAILGFREGTSTFADQILVGAVYASAAWGTPTNLSDQTDNAVQYTLAGFADGVTANNNRLGAIWETADGSVFARVFTSTWSAPQGDSATLRAGYPTMVASDRGLAGAWSQDASLIARLENGSATDIVSAAYQARVEDEHFAVSDTGLKLAWWLQSIGNGEELSVRLSKSSAWQSIQSMAAPVSRRQYRSVAAAAHGDTALVVWDSGDGLWTRYFDGDTWQTATQLDADGSSAEIVAHGGGYVLAWTHKTIVPEVFASVAGGSTDAVVARTFINGSWGTQSVIYDSGNSGVGSYSLYSSPAGALLRYDESSTLHVATYVSGAWSALTDLGVYSEFFSGEIVASSAGFGLVWYDNSEFKFVEITGATVGSPETAAATPSDSEGLALASDGSTFLVIYRDQDGYSYRRTRTGGVWGTPVSLIQDGNSYRAVGSANGYAVLVADDSSNLLAFTYDGIAWAQTTLDDSNTASYQSLVAAGDGFAVLYDREEAIPEDRELVLRRFSGSAWSAAELLAGGLDGVRSLELRVAPGDSLSFTWNVGVVDQLWGVLGLPF